MKFVRVLAAVLLASSGLAAAHAEEASVHLFLNEDTAETTIDGLNVTLRAELTDKDLKDRDFMRRPRAWLTCYDNGRQILTIDTADDLDPWPLVTGDRDVEVDAKLTGFGQFIGDIRQRALLAVDRAAMQLLCERDHLRTAFHLGIVLPAPDLLAGLAEFALTGTAQLFDQHRFLEFGDGTKHLPDQPGGWGIGNEGLWAIDCDQVDAACLQHFVTGFLYDQIASKAGSGFDEDGAHAIRQQPLQHRGETGPLGYGIGTGDRCVIVAVDDFDTDCLGVSVDGLPLSPLAVLVLPNIGSAGGPKIGNRLDISLTAHALALMSVTISEGLRPVPPSVRHARRREHHRAHRPLYEADP